MRSLLHATLRSVAFLTRLPVRHPAFEAGHSLGLDVPAFPVAGLVAALPAALWLLLAGALDLSHPTASVGAVALLVAITGALHEDGLADVADGLFGHKPKDRALAIMKDSRIGAYGALALVLSLLLRISLLADLLAAGSMAAAFAVLGAAACSRGLMAWLWSSLPSADPGGLADRMGRPDARAGRRAAVLGGLLLAVPALPAFGPAAAVLPLVLASAATALFRRVLQRRIGGQTGDCLGAAQQIAEIALLFGSVLALKAG